MISNFIPAQMDPEFLVEARISAQPKPSNHYQDRMMVARRDIKAGEALISEEPLLAVTALKVTSAEGDKVAEEMRSWFSKEQLENENHMEDEPMAMGLFSFLFDRLLKNRPDLLSTDTKWLNHFCCDSPTRTWDRFEAIEATERLMKKKLRAAFGERKAREYLPIGKRFLGMYRSNMFEVSTLFGSAKIGAAVYRWSSYFNHACNANATYFMHRGQTIVVRALRDIKAGEEVCISYCQHPFNQFAGELSGTLSLKFDCLCEVCKTVARSQQQAIYCSLPNTGTIIQVYDRMQNASESILKTKEGLVALRCFLDMDGAPVFLVNNATQALDFGILSGRLFEIGTVIGLLTMKERGMLAGGLCQFMACLTAAMEQRQLADGKKAYTLELWTAWFMLLQCAIGWSLYIQVARAYKQSMALGGADVDPERAEQALELTESRKQIMMKKTAREFCKAQALLAAVISGGRDYQEAHDYLVQGLAFAGVDAEVLRFSYNLPV